MGMGRKGEVVGIKKGVCRKAFDETIQLGVFVKNIEDTIHFHLIPSLECHGHAIRFVGIVGCVGVVKGSGQIVHVHHIVRYVVVVAVFKIITGNSNGGRRHRHRKRTIRRHLNRFTTS